MNTICKRAVDTYGKETQIKRTLIALGELIVTINWWQCNTSTKDDVFSRIAEVIIMCDQLCYIVDGTEEGVNMCADIIDQKLKGLEWIIKEYIESANTQKS